MQVSWRKIFGNAVEESNSRLLYTPQLIQAIAFFIADWISKYYKHNQRLILETKRP